MFYVSCSTFTIQREIKCFHPQEMYSLVEFTGKQTNKFDRLWQVFCQVCGQDTIRAQRRVTKLHVGKGEVMKSFLEEEASLFTKNSHHLFFL